MNEEGPKTVEGVTASTRQTDASRAADDCGLHGRTGGQRHLSELGPEAAWVRPMRFSTKLYAIRKAHNQYRICLQSTAREATSYLETSRSHPMNSRPLSFLASSPAPQQNSPLWCGLTRR